MKKLTWFSATLVVAAASVLIAQQAQEQLRPGQDQPQIRPVPREVTVGPEFDKEFLKSAYRSNLFEVQLAEAVLEKVEREDVTRFAQMMIADHKQANQQIKQTAEQLDMELPDELADWQKSKLQAFKDKPSELVGPKYMFHQLGAHVQEIYSYRFAANRAHEEQVKQFARNMIPDLNQHLQQANRIADELAGPPGLRIIGEPVEPRPGEPPRQEQREAPGYRD